jgi:hypothetical protein
MKWIGWIALVLTVAGSGCAGLKQSDDPRQKNTPVVKEAPPPPPAVRPEDVNETNAQEQARALGAELKHDVDALPEAEKASDSKR